VYIVDKNIDYLSFTLPLDTPMSFFWLDGQVIEKESSGGGSYGYNMRREYQSGLVQMWHTHKKEMGLHCIYSGKAIARLEHSPIILIDSLLENGRKISRLDLAVTSRKEDGSEHELTPHAIAELALKSMVETKLMNGVQIGQDMRIQTAYFGSLKTRKRLFRAYDKGLEQGHVANFVVRYELETRQNATQLAKAVAEGKDIGALINNYISVIHPHWQVIMGAISQKPDYAESDKTNNDDLWAWLMDSCAPALGRAIAQCKPELLEGNLEAFRGAVMWSYLKNKK